MNSTLPRWGQLAAGAVMLGAAVAAGAVSMWLNVSHGNETNSATAVTFGLADVGKIVIPIVAAAIGWTMQTRLTLIACAAVSLMCAASYYADTAGRTLLAREGAATAYQGALADIARTRAELSAITETGTVASLEAAARLASDRAIAEGASGGCARRCLDAQESAAKLTERAGIAARRDTLTVELSKAKADAAATVPAEASGLATLAALATGTAPADAARWINAGKAGLSIVLLEALVFLSVPGAALLARAAPRDRPAHAVEATSLVQEAAPPTPAAEPVSKPISRKPRKPKSDAKGKRGGAATEQPERATSIVALRSQGLSERQIADRLGISKTTVNKALKNVQTVNFGGRN